MFFHHLKMAFRNLRKYKTQNIISIIGLAVGFACFAFSALWIRYEMSYDSFHSKADRIYRVQVAPSKWDAGGNSEIYPATPYIMADWLKANYPEIEEACAIRLTGADPYLFLYLDHNFCKIFDLPLPEDFFLKGRTDRPIAVIPELNHEGTVEFINELQNWDVHIQTTIPRWPANTNIQFTTAIPITSRFSELQLNNWNSQLFETYILIKNEVNVQVLNEKLDKVMIPEWPTFTSLVLTPITQLRYKDPSETIQSEIKFAHIQVFTIAGLLVILCALFNHLTLFVIRVRMRLRELALRKVNGASDRQIAATLYTDFLLVILLSFAVGFMLMALLLPTFKEFTAIGNNNINIYAELTFYAFLLILCGFVACSVSVLYFRKQVLNESVKGSGSPESRNIFQKSSLLVQLIISLGMMFCAVVFIKQIRFLQHTDLGVERHNIAAISTDCCPLTLPYAERIKQIPGIVDVIPVRPGFLRRMDLGSEMMDYEKNGEQSTFSVLIIFADEHFFDFFGVEIIEGTGFFNDDNRNTVYSETAMKELGEDVLSTVKDYPKVGVARDFYITPTVKAKPTAIAYPGSRMRDRFFRSIAYKYEEGMRQQTQQAITEWLRKEFPDNGEFEIEFTYMDDVFEGHFKSERALLNLLSVMTFACILIAVFGVYSLTCLSCQQRRKEIAIRKVHGAEVSDIMYIFFKEYLLLLALAALVAFPVGYLIMKRWVENYVKQTSMDAWIFALIFLIVFVVIVFSIFSTIWKAANENPAEVVKSE